MGHYNNHAEKKLRTSGVSATQIKFISMHGMKGRGFQTLTIQVVYLAVVFGGLFPNIITVIRGRSH